MTVEELFSGDGEMAARMRAKDWSATTLGPVEGWPVSLRTIVRVLLHSRHPMFLWWGPELIQFYNDAYVPSFGRGKHPAALGLQGRVSWPEIWPIIGPQINDVMREGKASWNEDQLVPIFRNGRIEDVYWTYGYSPVFDDAGKIGGTLVVCTETTGRILSEQSLRRSEERLRRVVEASGAGTWELDLTTGQLEADARMAALFGLPEAAGFSLPRALERVHPEDRERMRATIDAALAGEQQGRYLVEHRVDVLPGAPPRWVEARGQVCFDGAGKATRFVATALDISERKWAEEEGRRARQELHSFLMQAPLGIAILSGPNHVYTFANPSFMSMLFGGRPVTDLLNKSVREALPELEGQGYHEILDGVYQTGKSFMGAKLRASIVQADGTEREMFVNFTYQAKRNPAGQIDGILAVIYEVTDQVNEQKEIELLAENLRAAIVSRDTFLGVASHELNTPLTTLKLQTQMSQRALARQGFTAFPPGRFEKLLDTTLLQVERLGRLVNDMLDVSRISTGKLTVMLAQTNLSALVSEVLERFAPQFDAAGCRLALDIEDGIALPLDAARIEQVLTNFIINALKYAPGKPVHAKLERRGRRARFSLRDEGIGIPPEHHERIFVRFERATSASEASGLGLGLYISKQIIQGHGGTIAVESAPDRGSTFSFELRPE
ncbi:PAS domain-containing sensor histidine kinase [Corallococcus llansteffanensis]|uniref:histidine kinase n=1 Tax=Corallococcus llansteffanensis TaxID=2316731 RepID=A0A3A8P1U4_9BACT|nr:ATP-binding protein [Corallococcus llansteffanensis]RKH49400.1 PAS domain S-box protein [Corallococcus llansteffanensis]